MPRIKLFLGGYVNYLNAQNINCRALSETLDSGRFDITAMLFPLQTAADFRRVPGVRYLRMRRPGRLWRYILYFIGIARADVAYLPKGEISGFCLAVARCFKTNVFTTVEGLLDDFGLSLTRMTDTQKATYIANYAKFEPNLYAITRHISRDVAERRGLRFADRILYLGVNSEKFNSAGRRHGSLSNIIFIGNTPSIKNISDFFSAAEAFPGIRFHIVGGNELKNGTVKSYIADHGLANVTYHGRLDHTALAELLKSMDLMYFPSRSEGFPKVHLETACAGVPTLCYSDYGASEWIDSGRNGLVVDTPEEALREIERLRENPEELRALSEGAVELGRKFDWKNTVGIWAEEIERLAESK